jgi:DNA polymerase-3 subunit delta'
LRNIIGHSSVVAGLRRAVLSGAVSHACIFAGESGIGKKTLARAYAAALQCEAPRDGYACGVCRSCRLLREGRHPDVFYVSGTNKKSIGAEDVREQMKHPLASKPFGFKYKIIIVDGADTMTPQAQNAMLKIIEEPPAYGLFIFLAERLSGVLPTVLSRCVVYKLKPLTDDGVKRALTARGLPADGAAYARGNLGRAIEMASSEGFGKMAALAAEVSQTIRGMSILSAMAFYRRFDEHRESISLLLDMLYINFAQKAVQCTDAVVTAKKALERNCGFQLVIELMLIELAAGGTDDSSWCAV